MEVWDVWVKLDELSQSKHTHVSLYQETEEHLHSQTPPFTSS